MEEKESNNAKQKLIENENFIYLPAL